MATVVLSAAGAAVGSSIGGSVLGVSATAVGRFVGAAIGQRIDTNRQRPQSSQAAGGSELVETARIERFRMTSVGEGQPIAQVFGRFRVGGHVIWSTEFREEVSEAPSPDREGVIVRDYLYSVSLAIALCEGEVSSVNRVWADGEEVPTARLNMRVHRGARDQMPDPKIEAVEGAGHAPAYRGTAYVVMEDLELAQFGNRVPNFSFEVTRPDWSKTEVPSLVQAVAMIPGTGEYALSTKRAYMNYDGGAGSLFPEGPAVVNVHSPSLRPDFNLSLTQLRDEMRDCRAASLVVSWFGNDLRCGECEIHPKVEQSAHDARDMHWSVSGQKRGGAKVVPKLKGRAVYGGTPDDVTVVQAIERMKAQGLEVMYYPFILMDQMAGNALPNPWTGEDGQPELPWRGRITLSLAPDVEGSPDQSNAAEAQVAAFFGTASASDFAVVDGAVDYSGPDEWRFRRFILHQASLCKAAGGVSAFCIGSEMRGLTQIRGPQGFPAVQALRDLAAECRALLGPEVKISYAADWSEYFGYHPQDGSGDVWFHLDPLWADENIDFIGIDNYMPLSDWREGEDHADAHWRSIYAQPYLRANIEGGEGYDWYYPSDEARAAQRRVPIEDGAYDMPWVWRYKDIRNWWGQPHHNRIGGVKEAAQTDWVPQSKPIWFTELGCAAVDKGTNQPNKFLDAKSSESQLPHFSNGLRDEVIPQAYLRAMLTYWGDPVNNPVSVEYGGPMLDMSKAFVWAWDARPYPWFPALEEQWSDGPNYRRGHWLNGRVSARRLASVVAEICTRLGALHFDVSGLYGIVRGYALESVETGRQALQPLMLAYGFDAVERDGLLVFQMRNGAYTLDYDTESLAIAEDGATRPVETRASEAQQIGRVRMGFVEADGDFQVAVEEAIHPQDETHAVSGSEYPLVLTSPEARQTVERWLAESRVSQDGLRFALPPSAMHVGAGDVLRLDVAGGPVTVRVDRVEVTDRQLIDAVRIEPEVYRPAFYEGTTRGPRPVDVPVPVTALFMDLPLLSGAEVPHAPTVALSANPWPGDVAIYGALSEVNLTLKQIVTRRSATGILMQDLPAGRPGVLDRHRQLEVRLASGSFESLDAAAFLAGGNALAIGDGSADGWEVLQFQNAHPLGEGRWVLDTLLRGQAGSDAQMPEVWPAGSYVVALNGAPAQLAMAENLRGLTQHLRVGPAVESYDAESYTAHVMRFQGNGLRPYRPVHLRASAQGGDTILRWIRRTRIDGDSWDGLDVPLGEEVERYHLRIRSEGALVRQVDVSGPEWTYTAAEQSADGVSAGFRVEAAQVSARFGAGPYATLDVS